MVKIKNQSGSKETGPHYPQVSFNFLEDAFSILKLENPCDAYLDLTSRLRKGAKLTDFLSQGSIPTNGFLISERVKKLLSDFDIIDHCFMQANVMDGKGVIHEYFWMHLDDNDSTRHIDYKNSVFKVVRGLTVLNRVSFKDEDEMIFYKKHKLSAVDILDAEKISIKPSLLCKDLFVVGKFTGIVISDRLHDEFISSKITGLDYNKVSL